MIDAAYWMDAVFGDSCPRRRLYVGNLSFQTQWQDLKDHMRQVGDGTLLRNARVITWTASTGYQRRHRMCNPTNPTPTVVKRS